MKLICFLNLIFELKRAVVIKCCKNLKMQIEDLRNIVLSQYTCFISEKVKVVEMRRIFRTPKRDEIFFEEFSLAT
jgi:hypothetical protein